MRWKPLLRGADARRADRALRQLLTGPRARGASLAAGDAGIAVALAELAVACSDERAAAAARRRMERAIAAMAERPLGPSLFHGFPGIAWAAHHAFGEGSAAVDAAVARTAQAGSLAHDLLDGLTGLGVYALVRPRAGLGHVVTGLARRATHEAGGIAWETAVDALPSGALPPGTRRHLNLGLAHGLAGVIALLAVARRGLDGPRERRLDDARRDRVERQIDRLLEGAVRWLLAHRLPDSAASCFPGWIDPGVAPLPTRHGWCYGDAAIARALWLAARAADEPAWRRVALEVARRAAARPLPSSGAIDAGLCHGSAGLAHIYHRHWQATGETVFAEAARRWFGCAIARVDRVAGGGLLSGRAGVALALLHATTAREPTWDRVLLLS